MKLIKLGNSDNLIVVNDEKPEENDFVWVGGNIGRVISSEEETLLVENTPFEIKDGAQEFWVYECKKITHSTEPLDIKITEDGIHLPNWSKVKPISFRQLEQVISKSNFNLENKEGSNFTTKDMESAIKSAVIKFGLWLEEEQERTPGKLIAKIDEIVEECIKSIQSKPKTE